MTMQRLDGKAADREGAAPRLALGEPALSEGEKEMFARWEKERAEQREIFEARREEILAAHPGKHIAVCNGEVFVADTALGARQWTMQNHIGREAFYYMPRLEGQTDDEAYMAEIARSERETDRQQEIFETGATVTMVRGDICHNLSLVRFGRRPVTCVHGSHADAVVQRYLCAIDLGGRERRLVIYELGNVEEGGNAIDAILGLDMLEGCRMELDWVRMEGVLEV